MTPTQEKLFSLQDLKYKEFNRKLIPTVNPDTMIGVRIPQLRQLAKEMAKEKAVKDFLQDLPHKYYEENILHVLVISSLKDFEDAINAYQTFLPFMDNWVVTDSQTPIVFKKKPNLLLPFIDEWLTSSHEYTIRFAVFLLMSIYLEEDTFENVILEKVCTVYNNKYYVNMMRAWFFATALAKQYKSTIIYLEDYRLIG